MGEIEPQHEIIHRGDLFFLNHPGPEDVFSGYGLAVQTGRNDLLVGVLMVDRPYPVDPLWLRQVEETFGDYQLVPMTASDERGILCRMHIDPDSIPYLQKYPFEKAYAWSLSLISLQTQHSGCTGELTKVFGEVKSKDPMSCLRR